LFHFFHFFLSIDIPVATHLTIFLIIPGPRREFIILGAAGTYRLSPYRPVDYLRKLLEKNNEQLVGRL
jgi:hypothetical protein